VSREHRILRNFGLSTVICEQSSFGLSAVSLFVLGLAPAFGPVAYLSQMFLGRMPQVVADDLQLRKVTFAERLRSLDGR
jgi:hypothetical protein